MKNDISSLLSKKGLRQIDLARALGINKSTVSRWKRIPAERVAEVESITGISRHDLRPDVFGKSPEVSA